MRADDVEGVRWLLLTGIIVLGVGTWVARQTWQSLRRGWDRRRRPEGEPPRSYGFPVTVLPAVPVTDSNDGPGRYRIAGVVRKTGVDIKMHVEAATMANARAKAELNGVLVTGIEKDA